jgi:hypothetical protein
MNKYAVLTVLLIISIMPAMRYIVGRAESAGDTVLLIAPSLLATDFPQSFIVNVSIANVNMLGAWQVKILFNPFVMTCNNVTEPPDNILGNPNYTLGLGVTINNTLGTVIAHDGIFSTVGVSGSGTLCQILFNVSQPGISSIAFADLDKYGGTVLYDAATGTIHIPFSPVNGFVQVNSSGFQSNTFTVVKDVFTYNVTIFANSTISDFDYNQTNEVIRFNQTGPNGSKGLCTTLVPLNLMNVSYFAVLINGNATSFADFKDGTSNFLVFTYSHSTVEVKVLPTVGGDLDGDRKVSMRDVAIVGYSFGSTPSSGRWNPIADTNCDMKIDMRDIAFVALHFGQSYNPA